MKISLIIILSSIAALAFFFTSFIKHNDEKFTILLENLEQENMAPGQCAFADWNGDTMINATYCCIDGYIISDCDYSLLDGSMYSQEEVQLNCLCVNIEEQESMAPGQCVFADWNGDTMINATYCCIEGYVIADCEYSLLDGSMYSTDEVQLNCYCFNLEEQESKAPGQCAFADWNGDTMINATYCCIDGYIIEDCEYGLLDGSMFSPEEVQLNCLCINQ